MFVYVQGNRPITTFAYGELPTGGTGCPEVGEMMNASVPGSFATGDVLCSHVRQVVVIAVDGAKEAMAAERFLPGPHGCVRTHLERRHPVPPYSTDGFGQVDTYRSHSYYS